MGRNYGVWLARLASVYPADFVTNPYILQIKTEGL